MGYGKGNDPVRYRVNTAVGVAVAAGAVAGLLLTTPVAGQIPDIPRLANGRPDLNGIWQAVNTANYDLEPHVARSALALTGGSCFLARQVLAPRPTAPTPPNRRGELPQAGSGRTLGSAHASDQGRPFFGLERLSRCVSPNPHPGPLPEGEGAAGGQGCSAAFFRWPVVRSEPGPGTG